MSENDQDGGGLSLTSFEFMEETSSKISGRAPRETGESADGALMTAIVKVTHSDYVPEGVKCRARISDKLFTADFSERLLSDLQNDERVISVELTKPLPKID